MSEWRILPLGELCEGIFDGPHATPAPSDTGPIFLGIDRLNNGRLDLSEIRHISEDDFPRWTKRVLPAGGDIVFSYETRLGQAAIVPEGLRCCLGRRMGLLRVDRSKADPRFLLYAFIGPEFQEVIQQRTIHGSTVERIALTELPTFPVRVPSLATQQGIGGLLASIDDRIETNHRIVKVLEEMAQALFKSWFVDFDPVVAKSEGRKPFGMSDEIAALFPDSFEESEVGPIPEGWTLATLGTVAENPRRGINPSNISPDTPYFGLEHLPRRRTTLDCWDVAGSVSSGKLQFFKNEILFGKLRPYFHKVGVAPLDGICSTDILVIRPKEKRWFGFLLGHVSSVALIDHVDASSGGTRMPRTDWQTIARYPVVLPPPSIAAAFDELTRAFVSKCMAVTLENKVLASMRDALLPVLLSGELHNRETQEVLVEEATAA